MADTVRDLRVAEVVRQDVVIESGEGVRFPGAALSISFKYESGDLAAEHLPRR